MKKNLTILLVTVLLIASLTACASAKKSGEIVSLTAADTVSQDDVTYDFLWTVEDESNPDVDLASTGVLSDVTGSQAAGFSFPTPVVPKGQTKKFKVKAKLIPKTSSSGSLATCIGESTQEIIVEGPSDSEIGDVQTICETELETECERDPSIPDNGAEVDWFVDTVDDSKKVNHPSDRHKAKIPVAGKLSPGRHKVIMRLKDKSGQGTETTLEKDLIVVHKPKPTIT